MFLAHQKGGYSFSYIANMDKNLAGRIIPSLEILCSVILELCCSNLPEWTVQVACQGLSLGLEQTKANIVLGVDTQQQVGHLGYTHFTLLQEAIVCELGH